MTKVLKFFTLGFILALNVSCAQGSTDKYNCYAVSYVKDFATFATIPLTEGTSKKDSEKAVNKEIEDSVAGSKNEKFAKTVRVSDNTTETPGSGLTRYFCFPTEIDNNKDDKTVSNFVNSITDDLKSEKLNSIFPL